MADSSLEESLLIGGEVFILSDFIMADINWNFKTVLTSRSIDIMEALNGASLLTKAQPEDIISYTWHLQMVMNYVLLSWVTIWVLVITNSLILKEEVKIHTPKQVWNFKNTHFTEMYEFLKKYIKRLK